MNFLFAIFLVFLIPTIAALIAIALCPAFVSAYVQFLADGEEP